jgi:hypothetical protein
VASKIARYLLALCAVWLFAAPARAAAIDPAAITAPPRLVVVLVIDQLRADYLTRFHERFGAGGFRWLAAHGAWYPQAEHRTLNGLTAPGHATILTGAYPASTGIVQNQWHDAARGAVTYCVADERHTLVGTRPPGAPKGTSPSTLLGNTLGDAMKLARPKTRVVSVAMKDRAAILLGGFSADAALWFDPTSFQWVSSTFYAPSGHLPEWADALNAALLPRRGQPYVWEATGAGSGASADGPVDGFRLESTVGSRESGAAPPAIDLTVDAAIAAVDGLALGRSGAPDLLAVSFAPLDHLGHAVGPTSRQLEELFVAHDAAIARLLTHLDRTVPGGLDAVTVALTGDHGAPPIRSRLDALRIPSVPLDDAALRRALEAELTRQLGTGPAAGWTVYAEKLHFYFDEAAIEKSGASPARVREVAAAWLAMQPGVVAAFTAEDVRAGRLPRGLLGEQIANSYFVGRSGGVVGVAAPFASTQTEPVIHMTGYSYDRTVPLLLASRAVVPGVYAERAEIIDLAATLAFMTGVVPPALSEGRVLGEIFRAPGSKRR